MTKHLRHFHEPVPDYMRSLHMLTARFIEGNDGTGAPGEPAPKDPPPTPKIMDQKQGDPAGTDPKDGATTDEPLNEGGKKALESEREKAEAERKRANAAEARLKEYEDAGKTELQKAQDAAKASADELAKTKSELWMYKALADYPVPADHRHLVKGNTEEEVKQAAKSVSQLATKPGVVRTSGTTGDGSSPRSGSISEIRRQIAERNKNR